MVTVVFASSIQRHVAAPEQHVSASTVREALDTVFATNARLATYILDDQGHLRKHVTIFVAGRRIRDTIGLSDPIPAEPEAQVFVVQALSGG